MRHKGNGETSEVQKDPFESAGGERRRSILAAAQRCVASKGVHGTSMRDIARESGASASTVYRYFEGKSDLLRYLAEGVARSDVAAARRISGMLEHGGPLVSGRDADPNVLLEEVWRLVQPPGGKRSRDEDRLRAELWSEAARNSHVAEALRGGVELVQETLGGSVEPGFPEPRLLTAAFYGAHMLRCLESGGRPTREESGLD